LPTADINDLSPFLKSGITDAVFDMSPIGQLKKENNDLISDDYEKACLLRERPFNWFSGVKTP
jgi:hypothetical protein